VHFIIIITKHLKKKQVKIKMSLRLNLSPHLVHNGPRWASIAAAAVVGFVVVRKVARCAAAARKESAAKKRREAQKPNVVYLFAYKHHEKFGQVSAPCRKVETFLKLFKIPYEIVTTFDSNMSPTGRMPFAEINGETVTESAFIIKACMERFNVPETLTPTQVANGVAISRLIEESARLGLFRWGVVDNMPVLVSRFATLTKYPVRAVSFFVSGMRTRTIKMLNLHGYGDLTDEQYQQVFLEDVKAVEDFLTRSTFAVSDSPSRFDCTVYAWVKMLVMEDVPRDGCPAVAYAVGSATIATYIARVEAAMDAGTAAATLPPKTAAKPA